MFRIPLSYARIFIFFIRTGLDLLVCYLLSVELHSALCYHVTPMVISEFSFSELCLCSCLASFLLAHSIRVCNK